MLDSRSPHILNTSANLLGLCFLVFSVIKASGNSNATISDEITAFGALLFATSSLLSFLSMRSRATGKKEKLERVADNIFLSGLFVVLFIVLLVVFGVIK